MKLLFLHGWGFDASLWDNLRRELASFETIVWDRGYFGSRKKDRVSGPVLAIGHSLGSLMLAADPPADCIGFVAINGFDRFVGDHAVPSRIVGRMRRRCADSPREVLDEFRVRCGCASFARAVNAQRLVQDLDLLETPDARNFSSSLLVLHGGVGPVLSLEMRSHVFKGARRETLAEGGHLLPLSHPEWCASKIRSVLP